MKYGGKSLSGPRVSTVVIPRGEQELVFQAKAVLDNDAFDKLCPAPEPPMLTKPGKAPVPNFDDKQYTEEYDVYSRKRYDWMILESLKATSDLEWETIQAADSDTWNNWRAELTSAGFSIVEIGKIIDTVHDACGLNQEKIEEATKRFLAGQATPKT